MSRRPTQSRTKEWYRELKKPPFAPPSWVFGPVWSILYTIIAISYGYTLYEVIQGSVPVAVLVPLGLNLLTNSIYTPLQFGLRNLVLASLDILAVLVTLGWSLNAVFPYIPWVSYANIPYYLWVSFATMLQLTITCMNREAWKV
jgi:tryptophan-rich sensory protein